MPESPSLREQIFSLDPLAREAIAFELFQGLAREQRQSSALPFPSIVATPNVCGGEPRLIRTRIPIWTLEQMRRLGISEIEILRSYPTIRATDLAQAWAYADGHREEMDQSIRLNEEA